MQPKPETVEFDVEQLENGLDQIEKAMGEEIARPFRLLLKWHLTLVRMIEEKNASIKRLRRLLFGARTERTDNLEPPPEPNHSDNQETQDPSQPPGDSEEGKEDSEQQEGSSNSGRSGKKGRKRPGHGRNPAEAYTGCKPVTITHETLTPGGPCPECGDGSLYRLKDWSPVVRLKGQPPVGGTRYQLENLRCNLCGKIHRAERPEEAGPDKYDPTVASIIGLLRYGEGMPWKRIERIQKAAGIPMPASVQWQVVRDAVKRGLGAVYLVLLWQAAQGELMHNDDTRMRVLELTQKLKNNEPLHDDPERKGVFTTNILSFAAGRPAISLFFTGPRHAGENFRDLLAKRMGDLPPPIQMCDALSRNMPSDLKTIVANCLAHGRRNFYELADSFPPEVRHVLRCLKIVYRVDARAKRKGLSPEERLQLHQIRSGPVMSGLHQWLGRQLDECRVEPNSSLGQAISYMLKHWQKLTLFLREPGAPLDNNLCEQALKLSIRHRKNSLYYRTQRGAAVGDLYMSLIHTCHLCGADPFDYLTALQRHHEAVAAAPADWMPWSYRQQLKQDTD